MPVLFQLKITSIDNFPRKDPVLVAGNHTAALEAVMLDVYFPPSIEMLSLADIPAERITEIAADLYGVIPLRRGPYDRAAMRKALGVLKQGGFIDLFPEGGVWQEGKKKALPGIAWLSVQFGAPVLPIGFNDTSGAMSAGLKFKHPKLTMPVGQVISPAKIPPQARHRKYLSGQPPAAG